MTEKPILAFDIDGVLLDYVTGLSDYARSVGHVLACRPEEITRFDLQELLPSLTHEQRVQLYVEFSMHHSFSSIGFYEGALIAVKRIRDRFPWLVTRAITSAGSHADTVRMRRENLVACGFDQIDVLPLGESKRDHLATLPSGSIFVDDLIAHVTTAEDLGLTGILFRRSYNTDDDHIRVVHDWTELEAVLVEALAPFDVPSFEGTFHMKSHSPSR